MIKSIVLFLVTLLLYSCSGLHFDNPMPFEGTEIKSFNGLTGKYYYTDSLLKLKDDIYYNLSYFNNLYKEKDSLYLISAEVCILNEKIFYKAHLKAYYNMNKIDTSRVILLHKGDKKMIENDFIIFEGGFSDTLIDLTKKDKLKFYKGKYFLNHYIEEHDWEIFQLIIKKDSLLSIGIINHKDKEKLKNYLINKNQIFGNTAYLSDSEFYSFIEKGGFRGRYRFKRE